MQKMKKLILAVLLFTSLASFGQGKFIEVQVTDTISLKPLNFQFNIYLDDSETVVVEDFEDYEDYDELASEENAKNRMQEVKSMLEAKKYKVGPLDDSKLSILERRFGGQKGLSISVNGTTEMQKLKELLDAQEGVTSMATVTKYADEAKAEEVLIKRLIDKAKARAAVIGANSELKVGKILEVKEGKGDDMAGLEDFYAQIVKMSMMGKETGNYNGTISKTFTVKFAAE